MQSCLFRVIVYSDARKSIETARKVCNNLPRDSENLDRQDIHLLIVDDDDRIRDLLKRYLAQSGFRVSCASDAQNARDKMQGLSFDMLILDVMMPGEDGVSLTQSLREHNDVPVILLTAKGEVEDRIEGLKAGADDYLVKPFDPEELVLRIESIFKRAGTKRVNLNVSFGPYVFDIGRQVLTKDGDRMRLTTGEEDLLTLLARRAGGTVSRYALSEKIAAKSERAVDVQMTRLRRKIEDNPAEPDYLITVRGQGYRLLGDSV